MKPHSKTKSRKPTGRESWFLSKIGKKIWRAGYDDAPGDNSDEYINGLFVSDKYHAEYLYSQELYGQIKNCEVAFFETREERDKYVEENYDG
jgi:hypothetical protein